MATTIEKLDRTQQERADIETAAGRTYEVRFVVTYINRDGDRYLAHASQGRCTYETPEAAQAWINAATKLNTDAQLRPVYGDVSKLAVRACAVYPGHHDPIGCFFDNDDENPEQLVAGVALELWSKLDENERRGITFGLFPAEKQRLAESKLGYLRDATRRLAVAVMEIAAHTPGGVSLASLSKVQRKGRYGSGRAGVKAALGRA